MKLQNMFIVWPIYFDASLSRSHGRKVPRTLALERPKLSDLCEAAERLGLNYKEVKDAKHPSRWWESMGYLILEKKFSKAETLRLLAKELKVKAGDSKKKP